jgi:signal transduction histidine kinase
VVWRQGSFRQQLLAAFLAMALLPALLLAVFSYARARRDLAEAVREAQARNLQGAISARNYLSAAFQAGVRVVRDLSDEPELMRLPPEAAQPRLYRMLGDVPMGYRVALIDPTGHVRVAVRPSPAVDHRNLADLFPNFAKVWQKRGVIASPPYRTLDKGHPALALGHVIRNADGKPVGLAVVTYNLSAYETQLSRAASVGETPAIYVIASDGRLLFGSGGERQFPQLADMSDDPAFVMARHLQTGTLGPYWSPVVGRDLLGAFASVPPTGVVVVVTSDYDAIWQEAMQSVRSSLAMLIPAALLALGAALLLSRRYSRPVTDLYRMVRELPEGGTVAPPASTRTASEFVYLADAIAETSQELAQNTQALEQSRLTLERRLDERTRSLVRTNQIIYVLAAAIDLRPAFQTVLPMIADLVGADAALLFCLDERGTMFEVHAHHPRDLACPDTIPVDEATFGPAVLAGRTWIDADLTGEAVVADQQCLQGMGFRSRAVLPISLRDGRIVAAVCIVSRRPEIYEAGTVRSLVPVLEQVGMAIDRDQLLRDTERRRLDAEALARVAGALSQSLRLEELAPVLLNEMRSCFATDTATLWLVDDEQQVATCVAGVGERAVEAVGTTNRRDEAPTVADLLAAGKPVLMPDVAGSPLANLPIVQHFGVRASAWLPLRASGQHIGFVLLTYARPETMFPESRLDFALALASQAATTIANARLFDRLEKALVHLQSVQEQLVRSERMSALGQLSSFVSHEIKNRFNVIMTAASLTEMIADRPGAQERIKQTMATIKKEVDRGNELMLRLLSFAKPKVPTQEMVSLPAVLDAALLTARRANVQIVRHLPPDLPQVSGDPASLEQVFLNLILNALQAMPGGGTLTVSATVHGPWVEVQLGDTGTGMSAEALAHLFQPFFTTKSQGTGLGLVISRQIIDQHRGTIACESTPGQGTTFTIRLPRPGAEPSSAPDIHEAATGPEEQAV